MDRVDGMRRKASARRLRAVARALRDELDVFLTQVDLAPSDRAGIEAAARDVLDLADRVERSGRRVIDRVDARERAAVARRQATGRASDRPPWMRGALNETRARAYDAEPASSGAIGEGGEPDDDPRPDPRDADRV
jgi:hypothetical protein